MLQWITGCFQHFLNTFIQVDERVIEKMYDIENSINNLHQDIEKRIDEAVEKVKDYDDYREVQKFYRENDLEHEKIRHEWWKFEQFNVGEKIGKLLENVEETDESIEWYCVVGKIQDRFKEKFKGWWGGDCLKYPKQSTCIICSKRPNCLNQYKLSKEETNKWLF